MSKAVAALAIIGFLLATTGLIIAVIPWLSPSGQTMWYDIDDTTVSSNPVYNWIPVSGLTITFDLKANETIYCSYIGIAVAYPKTYIQVQFKIDGVLDLNSYAWLSANGTTVESSISVQYFRDDLSAGIYNVSVVVFGSYFGNTVRAHTLFLQKFPSY
jgi:hypothetical protein